MSDHVVFLTESEARVVVSALDAYLAAHVEALGLELADFGREAVVADEDTEEEDRP